MDYSVAIFSFTGHQNLLPYVLKSVQKNLKNYKEIVVVWDDYLREIPIDFESVKESSGVDFRVVKHTEIYDWPRKIGEWGWIKQQLSKMMCYTYINNERTYIVDGDVVFTGDPELFDQNKLYLRQHKDCPVPENYKFFMKEYLGIDKFSEHTYVGSTCMFEHDVLKYTMSKCFEKNRKTLVECVNEMIESKFHPDLPFSEFEIYGHICSKDFANRFTLAERNWCYNSQETRNADPIKIMWADNNDTNLDEKYNLLTTSD